MQENLQKYLAELIGTFIFVFVATGATLANWQGGGTLGTLGVALACGLALAAVIFSTNHISGGHINPAVTIAMWATGHMKTMVAAGYVIAQLVGAVAAALLISVIFSGMSPQYYLGDVSLAPGVSAWIGILVEAILTFILVWAVFATLVDKKATSGFGAFVVGAVLAFSVMIAGNITMGALNPARSFGPALISSHWANHYVYWVGPIIGGLVAAFIYHFGFLKRKA